MGRLFVPYDKDWDKEEPLWSVGFDTVYYDEEEIANNIVWFYYQVGDTNASQWDNFSVQVNLKSKTVKGDGSRKFREFILEHVLYWYLKAKEDSKFSTLLN